MTLFSIIGILVVVAAIIFFLNNMFGRNAVVEDSKKHVSIDDRYNINKANAEKEVNRILDKVNSKGMNSLNNRERSILQEYSDKL